MRHFFKSQILGIQLVHDKHLLAQSKIDDVRCAFISVVFGYLNGSKLPGFVCLF